MRDTKRGPVRRPLRLTAYLGTALLALACSSSPPARDLGELVIQDSTYYAPETMEPYTGDVFRYFPEDSGKVQLRGTLRDGTWNGELVVYHPNGRVRYMGSLAHGVRCGAWTENADADPPESVWQELKQEVEAMGLYPPCPES